MEFLAIMLLGIVATLAAIVYFEEVLGAALTLTFLCLVGSLVSRLISWAASL